LFIAAVSFKDDAIDPGKWFDPPHIPHVVFQFNPILIGELGHFVFVAEAVYDSRFDL
jgi:hypothetical protein